MARARIHRRQRFHATQVKPNAAAARGMRAVMAELYREPDDASLTAEEYLAEQERLRLEAEASGARQGNLLLGRPA